MSKNTKYALFFILFIIFSNLPPLKGLFHLFVEGILVEGLGNYEYSTKDKKYIHSGRLEAVNHDACFNRYKLTHPNSDWTLYRIDKIPYLKFWRWYEVLTEEKWRQPYLELSREEAYKIESNNCKNYPEYYGDTLRKIEAKRYGNLDYGPIRRVQ